MSTPNKTESRQGLSKKAARLLSSFREKSKSIVSIEDIKSALKCSDNAAWSLASALVKKRWLDRIAKGKYLILPLEAGEEGLFTEDEFIIASELADPYYIGFFSALNFHGLTEQVPFTVFIATSTPKRNRKIHNTTYQFVTLGKKKFFGFQSYAINDKRVYISEPEKTIIDGLDHPNYSGGIEEIAKALNLGKEMLKVEKLVEYAVLTGNGTVIKRLRYLLDLTGYQVNKRLGSQLLKSLSSGYSLLDPSGPDKGNYNSQWRLRLNISEDRLHGDQS